MNTFCALWLAGCTLLIGFLLGGRRSDARLRIRLKKAEDDVVRVTEDKMLGIDNSRWPMLVQEKCPGCGYRRESYIKITKNHCVDKNVALCPARIHTHVRCKNCKLEWAEHVPENNK